MGCQPLTCFQPRHLSLQFSDADFPQWRGWRLIDDSADQDSRCNSATIRGWLDTDGNGQIDPAEATARLGQTAIAAKMAKTIARYPNTGLRAKVARICDVAPMPGRIAM